MYALNITDDYNYFTNCTNNENKDVNFIIKYLLPSIPANTLLFHLIGLIIYTMIEPIITNK